MPLLYRPSGWPTKSWVQSKLSKLRFRLKPRFEPESTGAARDHALAEELDRATALVLADVGAYGPWFACATTCPSVADLRSRRADPIVSERLEFQLCWALGMPSSLLSTWAVSASLGVPA